MNYGEIKTCDIANGNGVRVSLFVSGCTHHCKGCFNEMTWDFSYGEAFTDETQEFLMKALAPAHIKGLTLLGGEPMELENQKALLPFLRKVKDKYPQKDIWCYTGYLFDQQILQEMCTQSDITKEILTYIDVMVDGPFIMEKKDISLRFRGSSNQRIIDVQQSLKMGQVIAAVI